MRQNSLLAARVEYYDRQNVLMKILTAGNLLKINGVWSVGTMKMDNIQQKHKTLIRFNNVQYNANMEDSIR